MRVPDRILGLSLREHIGGRWAISLLAYAINAPINIALTFSGNASAIAPGVGAARLLGLSVLGYLGFGLVALLADLTVFRDRRLHPRPVIAVVLLGAVAGLVRGLVIALGIQALSVDAGAFTASRVITSTLLGAVLVPVLALLLSIVDAYRTQRARLVAQATQLQAEGMREDGASDAIRAALLASVRADLEEVARTGDPQKARDVGRRMWEADVEATAPRLSWRTIVLQSITRNPFPTIPVALVWALSAIGTLTATLGVLRGLAQVAASVIVIAAMFAVGRRWVRAGGGALAFITVMAIVVVLTGLVASAVFDPRPWPAGAGLVVANAVWLPMLTVAIGIVMTAVRASEEVLVVLAGDVDESTVELMAAHDETQRLRRELAAQVHGTVHSRLLAATAITSDVSVADAASAAIAETIRPAEADERPLALRIDEVVRTWRALMDVTVEIDDGVANEPPPRAEVAARVVEEALANAFRHGRAGVVTITVAFMDGAVLVRVEDDGGGLLADRSPGMGTALFEAASGGRWVRGTGPQGGTRVEVVIS